MKSIIKIIVPICFVLGLVFFIKNKSSDEVNYYQSPEKKDTLKKADKVNKSISDPFFVNKRPNDSIIKNRILAEGINSTLKEKNKTDTMIVNYLDSLNNYNLYIRIVSSKTSMPNPIKDIGFSNSKVQINQDSILRVRIENYRRGIIEKATKIP